ncbi:hypothetical protein Tco_0880347 [Tanacetum coccineum]
MLQAEKPPLTFDEFMSTPIDFTAFAMNRLKLDMITRAYLVGPVFNLLKGNLERNYSSSITKSPTARYTIECIEDLIPTLWSPVTIAYHKDVALGISHKRPQRQLFYIAMINRVSKHEVFSTMRIQSVVIVQIENKSGYGYLKEIIVRRFDQKLYKFKEGDFPNLHLNDIEDMLLLITQNKLFNLEGDVIVDFVTTLKMFTRRIIVQNRVEDVQLAAQKKDYEMLKSAGWWKENRDEQTTVEEDSMTMLFETHGLVESSSPELDLFSEIRENSEEETTEIMMETIEQYMSKTRGNYGSGVVTQDQVMLRVYPMSLTRAASRWLRNEPSGSITNWETLKTKFLNNYCPPARPEVIMFYNGLDVPTRQILDSKGAIPTKTAVDTKVAIQEMAEYSQKWHNVTSSKAKSTKTSDRLAVIQAQLNNLGREIKKVNQKVYAARVRRELCKGPHYTKDCPLKEEENTLKQAYYTQFGTPYQPAG